MPGLRRSVVRGPWSVVRGPWSVVRGPWSVALGAWRLVLGAWCLVLGAWCLVELGVRDHTSRASLSSDQGHWTTDHGRAAAPARRHHPHVVPPSGGRGARASFRSVVGGLRPVRGPLSDEIPDHRGRRGEQRKSRKGRNLKMGPWSLVLGAWCLVLGAWCLVELGVRDHTSRASLSSDQGHWTTDQGRAAAPAPRHHPHVVPPSGGRGARASSRSVVGGLRPVRSPLSDEIPDHRGRRGEQRKSRKGRNLKMGAWSNLEREITSQVLLCLRTKDIGPPTTDGRQPPHPATIRT
ncbi:hypothetical protein Hsar01_00619 [Haloferula sargassicola]|uniref:Uncharacterized protein n=1 Tax=Haloferula sargassicola TaxID=490096 RepID=A0ABP9UIC7_9BACT